MEQEIQELNKRLTKIENNLNGLTNDPRQVEVIRGALEEALRVKKFGINREPIGTQGNILGPSGGTTIDGAARTAINSILSVIEAFGLTF